MKTYKHSVVISSADSKWKEKKKNKEAGTGNQSPAGNCAQKSQRFSTEARLVLDTGDVFLVLTCEIKEVVLCNP